MFHPMPTLGPFFMPKQNKVDIDGLEVRVYCFEVTVNSLSPPGGEVDALGRGRTGQ